MAMRKNQKIGITTLLIPLLAILLVALFQKLNAAPSYDLNVTFREVGALKAGDAVSIQGVRAGRVKGLSLLNDSLVLVTIEVPETFRIPKGSQIRLMSVGALGERAIGITRAPSHEYYSDNDTVAGVIPGTPSVGQTMDDTIINPPISDKLDSIIFLLHQQNQLVERLLKTKG
jgi:ABC-type transporter Mla subunit MlaD